MSIMMLIVLVSSPSHKLVQGLHLCCHLFHLRVHNADRFFVNGFCGGLYGGIMDVDSLYVLVKPERLQKHAQGILTFQSPFSFVFNLSLDFITSSTSRSSFVIQTFEPLSYFALALLNVCLEPSRSSWIEPIFASHRRSCPFQSSRSTLRFEIVAAAYQSLLGLVAP